MNREKLTLCGVLFLVIGLSWIMSYWNGSAGFSTAHPVVESKLTINVVASGWPALGGMFLSIVGALTLIVDAVLAVMDLATAKRA